MQTVAGRPDRTLLVIVSLIAAVAIVALIVVFTRGAPAALDRSTPEGVVQEYTRAVIAGDRAGATEWLSDDLRTNCDRAEPNATEGTRVTLASTKVTGDGAEVRVAISSNSGGGAFGSSDDKSDATFTLVQEDGAWMIDTAPWEFTICYNGGGDQ